jgi:hypothetical protein
MVAAFWGEVQATHNVVTATASRARSGEQRGDAERKVLRMFLVRLRDGRISEGDGFLVSGARRVLS